MRISSDYNPYATGISSGTYEKRTTGKTEGLVRSKELEKVITEDGGGRVSSSTDLLSKPERNFFVKMFPESKVQIENHTLFNRKGRVQTTAFAKGQLVDARV